MEDNRQILALGPANQDLYNKFMDVIEELGCGDFFVSNSENFRKLYTILNLMSSLQVMGLAEAMQLGKSFATKSLCEIYKMFCFVVV